MSQDTDSFAALFQEIDSKPIRRLTPGQKITATIVGMSGESVFLDTGGKSEGILNSSELLDENNELKVAEGDKIDVYFLKASRGEQLFTTTLSSGKTPATWKRPAAVLSRWKVLLKKKSKEDLKSPLVDLSVPSAHTLKWGYAA